MYRRYYDGYPKSKSDEDNGEIIVPQNSSATYSGTVVSQNDVLPAVQDTQITSHGGNEKKGFLGLPCELDDLILIGVLLFLLWDSDNDDPIMLIILGFILLSDIL